MCTYKISEDFFGGNIIVESQEEDYAKVKINFRDSNPWCYWAFKVTNAGGKIITFDFGDDALGYFGPAVSYDLLTWHWAEFDGFRENKEDRFKFTYTFKEDENEVYFAHNFLYTFDNFKQLDFLKHSVLCEDRDGVPCLMGEMGEGEKIILLTARHHACEAPANYILEGVLREVKDNIPEGYKVVAVPFIDAKGVKAGDQGKGRMPHDHNRDYIEESIYPTVKAIKKFLSEENVKYVFDFHSPCHIGNGSDMMSLVNAYESLRDKMISFSHCFAEELTEDCFIFKDGVITFREAPVTGTFSAYVGALKNTEFVATLESPYFGKSDNRMTAERYLNTGRAFAKAILKLIAEKNFA